MSMVLSLHVAVLLNISFVMTSAISVCWLLAMLLVPLFSLPLSFLRSPILVSPSLSSLPVCSATTCDIVRAMVCSPVTEQIEDIEWSKEMAKRKNKIHAKQWSEKRKEQIVITCVGVSHILSSCISSRCHLSTSNHRIGIWLSTTSWSIISIQSPCITLSPYPPPYGFVCWTIRSYPPIGSPPLLS